VEVALFEKEAFLEIIILYRFALCGMWEKGKIMIPL